MKNKLFYFAIVFLSINLVHAQIQSPGGMPQMNNAEMKQLEAEIADFQKELESMPAEEQEAFLESMKQAVQKIDDLSKTEEGKALLDKLDKGEISDEELDQLINQIVGETEELEPEPIPVEEPKEAPKAIAKPKPVISSKHEQAINTINTIIAHSNAFIVKAATIPELPGKIIKWQKHKLVDWKPGLTWNKLKNDIEQLISFLSFLLERDHKTKEYYHIDALLKEESLYNNLKKIQHIVALYEPQIEEISLLHKHLTKTSKQAFQKMLSQYSEALYTLNIIEDLKKLVAQFQPKAKLSREEEEKAFQKAELEKKKKLIPGAPITVGVSEQEYAPRPSRAPQTSRPAIPSHPVFVPTGPEPITFPLATTGKPGGAGKGKAGSKGEKGKGEKAAKEDEEEDGKKEPSEKDDKLSALKKRAAKIDEKTLKEADKIFEKIADNLTNIVTTLKGTAFFENLAKHLTDESEIDFTAVTETMPELLRELSVRRGIAGNIEQLHRKLATPGARKQYQEKLKKLFEKSKNPIEAALKALEKIEAEWPKLANEIPASKKYAYFGEVGEAPKEIDEEAINEKLQEIIETDSTSVEEGIEKAVEFLSQQKKPVDEKLIEAQQKIPTPVSLFELKKNMMALKDMINNFNLATVNK